MKKASSSDLKLDAACSLGPGPGGGGGAWSGVEELWPRGGAQVGRACSGRLREEGLSRGPAWSGAPLLGTGASSLARPPFCPLGPGHTPWSREDQVPGCGLRCHLRVLTLALCGSRGRKAPIRPSTHGGTPSPLSAGLGSVRAGGGERSRAWGGGRLPHGPHWGLPSLGWVWSGHQISQPGARGAPASAPSSSGSRTELAGQECPVWRGGCWERLTPRGGLGTGPRDGLGSRSGLPRPRAP